MPARSAGGRGGRTVLRPVSRVTTRFWSERPAADKVNLDICWLRRESLEELDNQPAQRIIAREIVKEFTAALAVFEAGVAALEARGTSTQSA